MSEIDFLEVLKMFDTYLALLENPTVSEQTSTENVEKAFKCAHFIETTIVTAYEVGKESVLENRLHEYWLEERRSTLYKCSDLKIACDKLLEVYLKDSAISTDVVDEFLKLYTRYCGSDRLNNFLKNTVTNGICTNIIIESLEDLGIPESNMQDEALVLSWETLSGNGNQYEVLESIRQMFDDGYVSKLVQFATDLHSDTKVKQLIIQFLSNKLTENDESVCIVVTSMERKLVWKLIQCDSEFTLNLLDAIFYFARHMKRVENDWRSNCEFKYEHLIKMAKTLLSCPSEISEIMYNRVQLVKMQPNGTIWHDIEKRIGIK